MKLTYELAVKQQLLKAWKNGSTIGLGGLELTTSEKFGIHVKLACEKKRFTQVELAKRTGCSQANLSKIMRGKVCTNLEDAVAIATVLRIDLNKL